MRTHPAVLFTCLPQPLCLRVLRAAPPARLAAWAAPPSPAQSALLDGYLTRIAGWSDAELAAFHGFSDPVDGALLRAALTRRHPDMDDFAHQDPRRWHGPSRRVRQAQAIDESAGWERARTRQVSGAARPTRPARRTAPQEG